MFQAKPLSLFDELINELKTLATTSSRELKKLLEIYDEVFHLALACDGLSSVKKCEHLIEAVENTLAPVLFTAGAYATLAEKLADLEIMLNKKEERGETVKLVIINLLKIKLNYADKEERP